MTRREAFTSTIPVADAVPARPRIGAETSAFGRRWQEVDVVMRDSRATRDVAVIDCGDAQRVVRRVTVPGDVPSASTAAAASSWPNSRPDSINP